MKLFCLILLSFCCFYTGLKAQLSISASYKTVYKGERIVLNALLKEKDGSVRDVQAQWSADGGVITQMAGESSILNVTSDKSVIVKATADGQSASLKLKVITVKSPFKQGYVTIVPSKLKNAKITFNWLVLAYTKLDIPANTKREHGLIQDTLSQFYQQNIKDHILHFEDSVMKYTNSEIGFNMVLITLPERFALTGLAWDEEKKKYTYTRTEDLQRELEMFSPKGAGWFDNIHVFLPFSDPKLKPYAAFGGGSYIWDNIGRSQISIAQGQFFDGKRFVGTLHEGIHCVEMQYWNDKIRNDKMNIPAEFKNDDPPLHQQQVYGYPGAGRVGGDEKQEYQTRMYYRWMGDLLTGNIRDLNAAGGWRNYVIAENKKQGFGGSNGMYEYGPVRKEYKLRKGSPFTD